MVPKGTTIINVLNAESYGNLFIPISQHMAQRENEA